ncbi:hypothetical protein ACIQNG_29025 [Streptomyces sp. NPDC091377]|uniref:hypothetical protein n=1 Tax=Streptomyces sp. NPDC091377 TaxID=3365995 RepID=UPI0038266AB7
MGTVERHEAPGNGSAAGSTREPRGGLRAPDHDIPVGARTHIASRAQVDVGGPAESPPAPGQGAGRVGRSAAAVPRGGEEPQATYRPLWVEEPARRRRLPDPVRTSAVRAVLILAVTLIQAMVTVLATLAESWLAFPMFISTVVSTVVATWSVLDVWVTRQVWHQRNGVVSAPSSTARALRRERRRARRQARSAARSQGRISGPGSAGRLSHS